MRVLFRSVGESATDPATLCVDNQCGEKTVLLTIPSAENILFADDGRLFVSGGSNVFEITRDDDAYTATALYDGSCNFTGMAIVGEALYAACFDGQLRSEEHTSELQSLMRISYAVFCLKKKTHIALLLLLKTTILSYKRR